MRWEFEELPFLPRGWQAGQTAIQSRLVQQTDVLVWLQTGVSTLQWLQSGNVLSLNQVYVEFWRLITSDTWDPAHTWLAPILQSNRRGGEGHRLGGWERHRSNRHPTIIPFVLVVVVSLHHTDSYFTSSRYKDSSPLEMRPTTVAWSEPNQAPKRRVLNCCIYARTTILNSWIIKIINTYIMQGLMCLNIKLNQDHGLLT